MKSKCSFILKASTALVLAMLVLFSSIATVVGAVASADKGESDIAVVARKVLDIAETGAKVDLAETGYDALNIYGYVYMTKPSGWSNVGFIAGRKHNSWYSTLYDSTNISGTGLYYVKVPTSNYSASNSSEYADHYAMIDASGWGTAAQAADQRWGSVNHTNLETSYDLNDGSTYLLTGSTNGNISQTYLSSGYSALNNTLTIKTALKSGSTYSESSSNLGTFSVSGAKKINGNGSSTSSSLSTQTSGSATLSVARTNTATISQTASSGYTFKGWKTGALDTSGSSLTTGNYSFTNSGSNTTLYAYYEVQETTYAVTVAAGSNGSVASTSVNAGATTAVALPEATPNYGYKFKNWTANGGGVTITNATSATEATITATGTGGTVTANFEKNDSMNLYIAGRFHIYNGSSWVNSFDSGDWSNTGDDNIKFTWDSTAQKYKVDTGASPAELTSQISNINPYFFVYDKDNTKNWYATSSITLTNTNKSVTLSKSSGANNNLRFNATTTDKPVTLWFDPTTGVLSYDIPTFYDVTVSNVTGGTVTASPARTTEGTTVTLTITPSSGYQLSSITAKRTGTSTSVTLSGSGNTRTFTMPASGVTVTPAWSKIDYTLTKNSTSNGSFKLTNASGTEITKAQIGDTVKVVPTANTGYTVNTVKHGTTSSPSTSITASSGTYSFTMGAANEYVAVTFKEVTGTVKGVAYTSGAESTTGGTVNNASITVGIDTSKSITATKKTNYSFTGWQFSGANATKLRYRFGTSGDWLTPATGTTYGTASDITIYIKTDGSSSITTSNAEVRALFVPTTYSSLTAVAKFSTTGADNSYTNNLTTSPAVTINATSATYQTGVAVTAPLETTVSGVKYKFAGWTATYGGFANADDVETTFKPSANGSQAIAKYNKVYTITSSVDNTGTGAGTVNTSKTEVEAGGSYTITATAASHSAVESVKVNGTAKTATASQTISSVSADQTVVVKFKSNVYLKGTMNASAWAGDVMTANTAGTSYTIANVVLEANTTYQFRLYADDEWKANSVTTWTLNNIATHGTSGNNLTITPSVKAKVTFVSDGTKFTSITAIPYDSTTYDVTLTQSADYTITSTYMGVEYTTSGKNANVTVPVYSGTSLSYTVTPASGKYLSGVAQSQSVALSPAFSASTHAESYTGTVSVTKAFAISATTASKIAITAKTNKSARGTVSVSPTSAAPGKTITITVSPKNGVLKTLTYSYAGGKTYTRNFTANKWDEVIASQGAAAPKLDIAFVGANVALAAVGADANYTFTLDATPTGNVTVNATFDAYSAESTWYYNGYDNSGNALSGYHGKQMTEGMVSGEKFSYYHVEGRTGTDQLMTVSDGVPSSGTRYVYFVRPNNYGDGWSASNNPKAHFWKNGGQAYDTWPGTEMSWQWNNDYGQGVYKIAIPDGADRVSFNDATNNGEHQTLDIDLTTTSGAYYVGEWNSTYSKYNFGTWDTGWADQGWVASGTEYFYQNSTHNGDYTADFNTKGFYNHNTASKEFAKPKDLGTNTGDYYINVLYPNTTYTINGVTKKTGSNPMIIWSAEPLAGDDENVTIYAKDGSIRSETYGSTYANIADTKIYLNNETVGTKHSGNITNQTWETYKAAKGDTIVIKTQIGATDSSTLSNAAALKAKYYVRGFCVNGEVSQLLTHSADGLYTLTYKVPEDTELTKIEITPIYYLKDTTTNPIVTYRVTGFTDELKAVGAGKPNWGDTLYTYPFYGKLGSNNNALGAYPGQPMVYYKGQYQMQIPQKSTAWDIYYDDSALSGYSGNTAKANAVANTNVSGVTMSNGYYDIVHRQVMGYGDNSASADHVQTYDYGDFFKIFNEKKPVDNIVFDFKYETKKHNFENQPAASVTKSTLDTNYGTNGNGFELLTNYHGRHVDLFGTPLSGDAADPEKTTPVYVISIGGVNGSAGVENIAGYYATEWMVYGSSNGTSYNRISAGGKNSIPPEVLVLNDDDATSFNTTTYPSADASHTVTDWKALYTALEAYRGKPVMISYEAADAQIGSGNYATSGGGGATRNDGRWLYSKNGESITSTIKIQYSDDNGVTYTDLNTTTPQVSGLSAYFTNDGVEGEMTYSTTIDPDKTFDFEAKTTNGNYKFVGWYMADGTKITSDNVSHTERSGSYTFVAKFMQVQSGQLILSHSADKGTIDSTDYQGAGTAKISAVVKNGDEVVRTYDLSTSDITLDDKIIKSDSTYTIDVTLEATATGNDMLGTTVLATPSGQDATYFSSKTDTTSGKTRTIVLNSFTVASLFSGTTQNVKNIIYHSYFAAAEFNYQITFTYTDRNNAAKSFTRSGKLTSAQAANETYVDQSATKKLLPAFIQTIAPHVSNFGETITWTFDQSGYAFTQIGSTYTCTATVNSTKSSNNKLNVTFKLPYTHTNGIATGGNTGTASTSTDFALTGNNAVAFKTVPVLLNDAENGIYTEAAWKNWIAAPATITDGGTTKYFQYWSVKSTAADKDSDPEVARCYFQGFNFQILDNYTITAIYGNAPADISNSGIFTGATYLETSRNQWNTNKNSDASDKDGSGNRIAADLLFNDFVLNYNFKGVDIYKGESDSNAIQELGVVVERIKELDINQDGTKNTDISNYSSVAENPDTVKAVINNQSADKKFTKNTIAKTALDNKNRILFYDAFYNGAGWNKDKQSSATKYAYKNWVYRAYTYIKYTDDQENTQIVLSVPTYFTMYEVASASYVAPSN